jgi:hypothetical protein
MHVYVYTYVYGYICTYVYVYVTCNIYIIILIQEYMWPHLSNIAFTLIPTILGCFPSPEFGIGSIASSLYSGIVVIWYGCKYRLWYDLYLRTYYITGIFKKRWKVCKYLSLKLEALLHLYTAVTFWLIAYTTGVGGIRLLSYLVTDLRFIHVYVIWIGVFVYVYIYIYIHPYIYLHIHIYIHILHTQQAPVGLGSWAIL